MKKYHNLLHFFSVRVEEILEEVCYRLVGDVAAHNNMPPEMENVVNISN